MHTPSIDRQRAQRACEEALACARLHQCSHWACIAVACTLPAQPSEQFAASEGCFRRLLWQDDDYLLGVGISADMQHNGRSRYFSTAQDDAQLRSRIITLTQSENAGDTPPDIPCFIEATFESAMPTSQAATATAASVWGQQIPGCRLILPQRVFWKSTLHAQDWMFACCEMSVDANLNDCIDTLCKSVAPHTFGSPLSPQAPPPSSVSSTATPWHPLSLPVFTDIVEDAVELLQSTSIRKIVLARAVDQNLAQPADYNHVLAQLHQHADASSCCYAYDLDNGAVFIGASPELLFSLHHDHCATMALAGSRPRGRDAEHDTALAEELFQSTKERKEHQLVVEYITTILSERQGDFRIPNSPSIRKLAQMQHLETPLQCTLPDANAFDLLAAMHPTPAVCGLPVSAAMRFIQRHEKLHRGLYTGAIGFHTPTHSQFIVPLRGGIVHGTHARLFAGAGLVETSVAHAEDRETEQKLALMRHVLGLS